MKTHLTERGVRGPEPGPKNIIVYDEEVVGFGVRITSGGTRAFILTYRIAARERRLTIRLPAAEIEIAHAEITACGDLKSLTQGGK